jgi:hypothetical protein
MKHLKLFLLATIVLFGLQAATGQIDKGYIKMEITDVSSDNEQMMAMADMFKNSFTEIYFSPEKAFTVVNMMGGMNVTKVLMDMKTNENVMLMSMMGQKIKIKLDKAELDQMQGGGEQAPQINYEHFRDETKEIVGFKCHKVKISGDAAQGADMTLWVTDKIKTAAHVTNGIEVEALEGFPLEYVISLAGQLEMTMKATAFEKDFDKSVFEVDTTGYKEMTMDQFMEQMGGMGGM